MSQQAPRFWAIIPAAGIGKRMGNSIPKQYLKLLDKTVIEHTLHCLSTHPRINGIVIAIAKDDPHWPKLPLLLNKKLLVTHGGVERCHSVLNALHHLAEHANPNDWVLVHDAVRPCLRHADIDLLIDTLQHHPIGGLLGVPVADTIKRTNAMGDVLATIDRSHLWRALTPQMFRLKMLTNALENAIQHQAIVTDEAAAIERLGHAPQMVTGHADNIKITHPQDIALAELLLQRQRSHR